MSRALAKRYCKEQLLCQHDAQLSRYYYVHSSSVLQALSCSEFQKSFGREKGLAVALQEKEILKKAAAYFAKEAR